MRSAEEIAREWGVYFTAEGEPNNDAVQAMDEYAKQVAIDFAKFIVDGGWDKVAGDNYGEAFFVNPPEELFELYNSKL